MRLCYYRENDAGNGFDVIEPAAFPKRIATQNMWLTRESNGVGAGGAKIYPLELALKLDPDDVYFVNTLTADIWCELSGIEYREAHTLPFEKKQPILRRYAQEQQPIRLTRILPPNHQPPTKPH